MGIGGTGVGGKKESQSLERVKRWAIFVDDAVGGKKKKNNPQVFIICLMRFFPPMVICFFLFFSLYTFFFPLGSKFTDRPHSDLRIFDRFWALQVLR